MCCGAIRRRSALAADSTCRPKSYRADLCLRSVPIFYRTTPYLGQHYHVCRANLFHVSTIHQYVIKGFVSEQLTQRAVERVLVIVLVTCPSTSGLRRAGVTMTVELGLWKSCQRWDTLINSLFHSSRALQGSTDLGWLTRRFKKVTCSEGDQQRQVFI